MKERDEDDGKFQISNMKERDEEYGKFQTTITDSLQLNYYLRFG